MKRNSPFLLFSLLLILALACNYPRGTAKPTKLSARDLRLTLAAQSSGTALSTTSAIEGTWSPVATTIIGSDTATPESTSFSESTVSLVVVAPGIFQYSVHSGDTLPALAGRFGVEPEQITSEQPVPAEVFIPIGQLLKIPNTVGETPYPGVLLPDSEAINSPSAVEFDIQEFVDRSSGYLSNYSERVNNQWTSGADIIQRVAMEYSINPRLLLALLEYRSGWVLGQPVDPDRINYPIGFHVSGWNGLHKELAIAATHFNVGYYGWRLGTVTKLAFQDGSSARMNPGLNPGTVAVQNLFAKLYKQYQWRDALYGQQNFLTLYQQMFGDPWSRAAEIEPLFNTDLVQPTLELPFRAGERWSLTGGPHLSWKTGSSPGALDLAPVTGEPRCVVSYTWVTASAKGLVVRSIRNTVVIDLDGDGFEQTGWSVLYLHVADTERIPSGMWVEVNDPIGHPSCEGGNATGTHVHIARKYNGEWITAYGPLPMVLSGWVAFAGEKDYLGGIRKGEQVAVASPVGPRTSIVIR